MDFASDTTTRSSDDCLTFCLPIQVISSTDPTAYGTHLKSGSCPDNCNFNGICVNGSCACSLGWQDPTCAAEWHDCFENCSDTGIGSVNAGVIV